MPLHLCSCRLTDDLFSELAEASEKVVFHGKSHDSSLFIGHVQAIGFRVQRPLWVGLQCFSLAWREQTSMFFAISYDTDYWTVFFSG